MNRRSFFTKLRNAAAIIALAPQIAFGTLPDRVPICKFSESDLKEFDSFFIECCKADLKKKADRHLKLFLDQLQPW